MNDYKIYILLLESKNIGVFNNLGVHKNKISKSIYCNCLL